MIPRRRGPAAQVFPALLAAIALAAPGHAAADPKRTASDALADHAACVTQARPSADCAMIVTDHCLDTAENRRDLTACRAGMAAALNRRADVLIQALKDHGAHARAAQVQAGVDRIVTEFCETLGGRMATPDGPGHDVRCALMRAHVSVYHLSLELAAQEQAI